MLSPQRILGFAKQNSFARESSVSMVFIVFLLLGTFGVISPTSAQSKAYVAHQFGTGSLKIVELDGNTLVDSIPLSGVPYEVGVLPDGSRAYVSLSSNKVAVVDTAAKTVIAMIPSAAVPYGVAVHPDGTRVYVTSVNTNTLQVIDTATNSITASIPVGSYPIGVAVSPDGQHAYVTNHISNSISEVDTATNLVSSTFSLTTAGACGVNGPWTISVAPNGDRAVATNINAGCVTYVDLVNRSVIAKIVTGGSPDSVDISPDGLSAYVAVELTGSVKVIDLVSLSVSATIPEGISPWGIALSADGSRAYVANYNSGFTVIDTTTRAVIANVPMPQGTAHVALWEAPADSTPPTITPTVTGTLGNGGWYTSDVNLSWSIQDSQSVIASSSGCDAVSVATDTAGVTFSCTATSGGGTSTESVTLKRDATSPAISCASADGAWHAVDASIACSANDALAGLADGGEASFNLLTSVSSGTETSNASTNSRQVCDAAGNCGNAGPISGNKVDKKAPTILITSPVAGTYLVNQFVAVAFTCSDGGSGVASCDGTSANGGALDTASAGSKTFVVNSADNVGNAGSPVTVNYTVNFGVTVLFDQTKAYKSGSTVPIKIRLVDANGANVSSPITIVHAVSVIQTSSLASTTLDDSGNSNPDFDFRYDASIGGYIFNLKTTGYGTGSYQLNFVSNSLPTVYSVGFQVRQ